MSSTSSAAGTRARMRPASPRKRGRRRPVAVLVLEVAMVATIAAGCGEHEYERLGRELAERLVAEGYAVDKGLVYAPRGPVPHWVVELTVPGGEADAITLCRHVADTVTYEGEAVYLVRVAYQPSGSVECGWGKPTSQESAAPSASP